MLEAIFDLTNQKLTILERIYRNYSGENIRKLLSSNDESTISS